MAADLEVDPELIVTDLQATDQGRSAVAALLDSDDPPTAIFAGQNLLTIGAIRELRVRGLQHHVALVGFDDFELADLLEPAVTVVAQDPDAIGRRAAEPPSRSSHASPATHHHPRSSNCPRP